MKKIKTFWTPIKLKKNYKKLILKTIVNLIDNIKVMIIRVSNYNPSSYLNNNIWANNNKINNKNKKNKERNKVKTFGFNLKFWILLSLKINRI